jgi:hypothetical protein
MAELSPFGAGYFLTPLYCHLVSLREMSQSRAASDISKVRKDRSVHSIASRDDRSVIVLYYRVLCFGGWSAFVFRAKGISRCCYFLSVSSLSDCFARTNCNVLLFPHRTDT